MEVKLDALAIDVKHQEARLARGWIVNLTRKPPRRPRLTHGVELV
jgi:hypothetical protein